MTVQIKGRNILYNFNLLKRVVLLKWGKNKMNYNVLFEQIGWHFYKFLQKLTLKNQFRNDQSKNLILNLKNCLTFIIKMREQCNFQVCQEAQIALHQFNKFNMPLQTFSKGELLKLIRIQDQVDENNKKIYLLFYNQHIITAGDLLYFYKEKKNEKDIQFYLKQNGQLACQSRDISYYTEDKSVDQIIFVVKKSLNTSKYESSLQNFNFTMKLFTSHTFTIKVKQIFNNLQIYQSVQKQLEKLKQDQRNNIKSNITIDKLKILHNGVKLKKIKSQNKADDGDKFFITINDSQQNPQIFLQEDQKLVIITYEDQKISMIYNHIKELKISQILDQFVKNKKQFQTLVFGRKIIYPTERLKVIQQDRFLDDQKIQLVHFNNPRYFFLSSIKNIDVKQSHFQLSIQEKDKLKKILDQIKQNGIYQNNLKEKDIFSIFIYTSAQGYYQKLNSYLRSQKINKNQDENRMQYNLCCSLKKTLDLLNNYKGITYRGCKDYLISQRYEQGQLYCYTSFVSTSKIKKMAENFLLLPEEKGTKTKQQKEVKRTFHTIKSRTGKQVQKYSMYPSEQQVLFKPYCYFYIKKIQILENYQSVQLQQIDTPLTFQKPIILWVSDKKEDDDQLINLKLQKQNNISICVVDSTRKAIVWLREFFPLIKKTKTKFRVITNMKRGQNSKAGLDILRQLSAQEYLKYQLMIYCMDVQNAERILKGGNVNPYRTYKLTCSPFDFQEFIKI